MGAILVHLIRKVAEGDFGAVPKAIYWRCAGLKTWSGVVLALVWYALTQASAAGLCADCSAWAGYVLSASLLLVSVGLVDAGFRARPPVQG